MLKIFQFKKKENWQKIKIQNAKRHQFKAFDTINNVAVKKRHGKKIITADGEKLIEFASCSYLGLDQDNRVIEAGKSAMDTYGVNFAIARTRLRADNLDSLEEKLSTIFCNSYIALFSSLHITHLGFFPLLASSELPSFPIKKNGPVFIMDKVAHASMQLGRGILEQFGQVKIIDFQDKAALELEFIDAHSQQKTPITISDSVVSMCGLVPVAYLFELAEQYDGYVYLDDAHGTSIYGEKGCGYALEVLGNVFHPRLILTPSLSKGFGSNMAVLALPTEEDMKMVKRFAIPYLFSNPPPTACVGAAIAAADIHLSEELPMLQKKLWDNVALFDEYIKHPTLNKNIESPMRGVMIGNEDLTILCAQLLRQKGFFTTAAMYPTVELGKGIIRIALSALHTKKEIQKLCGLINMILDQKQELTQMVA